MLDDFFNSNEFKKQLQLYEQDGAEKATLDSEILTDIADYYRSQGQMDKALQAVDYALTLYPGATAPLIFKARAALADDDVQRADGYLESIDDKTDLDYLYMKAELMICRRQEDEADAYLEARLEEIDAAERPDYVLDVATLFGDYDLMELADKWLSRSDETDLNDYMELRGRILMAKGEVEAAQKLFEELVERNPFSAVYWNLLACTQYLQQRYDDTIASCEYAIAIDPRNEESLVNKANSLSMLGNYEEALVYYERYAKITRAHDLAEMYCGITLSYLGRYAECIPLLQNALAHSAYDSPHLSEIYHELVLALMKEHRTDEALQYVEEAEADPRTMDPNELKVLHGHVLLSEGQVAAAQRLMGEAYMDSGMSAVIVRRIAVSLYENGYTKMAFDMLSALLDDLDERNIEGYSYLAACAYELDRKDDFLKYLQVAVERNAIEARCILSELFPPETPPQDYYEYAKNNLI